MLSVAKQNSILINDEYLKYQPLIANVQQRLINDVELLGFNFEDKKDTIDYINDKVTLFRFLKESNFDENKAIARLLETIQWRKNEQIGRMTYTSVAPEFFENGFAFFHKQDLLGRPVAIVQMRHFPKFRSKGIPLSAHIEPFACLVLEIARQLTRDLTRKNEKEQVTDRPILISQITIIIDVAKAPFVPIDSNLMVALKNIVNARYPGFIGSVYILNFGWMFQGIWQVIKLVLSEQAKARVNFVSKNEISQVMDENNLLKVLGGTDGYIWSLNSDPIIDLYATDNRYKTMSPSSSSNISRRSSISSTSSDESVDSATFFDAPEYTSRRSSASIQFNVIRSAFTSTCSSVYATPGTLTPIESVLTNQRLQQQHVVLHRQTFEPTYFLTGFHTGDTFLTSFFIRVRGASSTQHQVALDCNELTNRLNRWLSSEECQHRLETGDITEIDTDIDIHTDVGNAYLLDSQHRQQRHIHFPHMLPAEHPQSLYMISPLRYQFGRAEQKMTRLTRKLFRLSFAYNGAVYWIVLYLFMRGPVENNLKKTLEKLMANASSQQITYTTLGITATLAAALSASFSDSLLQSTKNSDNDKRRLK
ncbi:hypothetical protein BDF20DRAFT_489107 [Mycotypha africana]|uniref:uncharacterized protein n=1 Tax=Mycotypha africana TaxID=64632 RepID=UPI0022FFE55A|nr:uncharacterized protein BDF20DRAFT_489107 [Mycotypha africana]KAI8979227.1 hypothetical protein BDF20DRAFT_489107 [Mycotypha africana]